ncbi:6120_t:CDS:2 [Ambispora leptoticha]|uniref:6120_t:CDS:1 n=1 Tax=Ambispora leptoticha TaxID=144679 RepID=A0A9N8V9Q4_9GLOM|nr:6120_t:CDS:2 [Ambispora leptoticha]
MCILQDTKSMESKKIQGQSINTNKKNDQLCYNNEKLSKYVY